MYHLKAIRKPPFLKDSALKRGYAGKRILVLGGDGFLGVHLAAALHLLGAKVSVLSRRNSSLLDKTGVAIVRGNLQQEPLIRGALKDKEILFDVAGSSGGLSSNRDPRQNYLSECEPHLRTFQCAAEMAKPPLVVFCSSRTVYGKPASLPVSESHSLSPISVYAIHKLTLEHYLQNLHQTRGLKYLIFRLSNAYGPYRWQEKKDYGVINQFILKAFLTQPIQLFGDASQLRDYIFIDDVVEAFLRASTQKACYNQVFNLGGPAAISIRAAVQVILKVRPGAPVCYQPWPHNYEVIETGDYLTDLGKLKQYLPAWRQTNFEQGVRRTLRAYEKLGLGEARGRASEETLALPQVNHRSTPPKRSHWSGKRVLVTGANGIIGGRLMARLLEMGAHVVTVNRRPLLPALAAHRRVSPLQLDLEEDADPLWRDVELFAPEVIFHMASHADGPEVEGHAMRCIDTNLRGTVRLLELARRLSVSAFVFAGSTKVYGNNPVPHLENGPTDPCSSYAASKLAAWNYCRIFSQLHKVTLVALRPTMVYGPGPCNNLFAFLARCLASGQTEIRLSGGLQTRDPLYLDDAVDAFLRAAQMAPRLTGRAIPIGGGCERSVKDLASLFVAAAGYTAAIHCQHDQLRPTEMMRSYCDNVEAWHAFGWRPETPLSEGLRLTATYILKDLTSASETQALPAGVANGLQSGAPSGNTAELAPLPT